MEQRHRRLLTKVRASALQVKGEEALALSLAMEDSDNVKLNELQIRALGSERSRRRMFRSDVGLGMTG